MPSADLCPVVHVRAQVVGHIVGYDFPPISGDEIVEFVVCHIFFDDVDEEVSVRPALLVPEPDGVAQLVCYCAVLSEGQRSRAIFRVIVVNIQWDGEGSSEIINNGFQRSCRGGYVFKNL